MKSMVRNIFFVAFSAIIVALAGCSSHSLPESEAEMVWLVNSPLTVEQNEYQCFMVMISGQNAEPRSAVCVLPRTGETLGDCMMATAFEGSLTVGFWRDKTMHLTEGDWDTVFLLQQNVDADDLGDPIRLRKTYSELGIPDEKRFLPEMIPILETMIRENVKPKESEN